MSKECEMKVAALRARHEELLSRPNVKKEWGNGIYDRYEYPIVTAEHTPLEWRYDFCEKDNPYLMQRIMMNATLNSGAIKWQGKYCLVVRVEGADRKDMKLPYEQDALISAVLDVNPNAIVVMIAGSPVDMSAWIDKAKALVWMSYNGMEGGTALAEVISGQICPSGKLAETWPVHYEDTPTAKLGDYPGKKLSAAEQKKIKGCRLTETYREGVFVGYRYYEKYNVPVQFAFGHGLSYVDFKYSAMEVKKSDKGISVSVKVTNSGVAAAKEAVQLYVGEKKVAEDNPVKELKGFDKIELLPGQTKTLKFELGDKDFSHFDIESASWKKMKGAMVISIGSASDDIRCKKEVTLK